MINKHLFAEFGLRIKTLRESKGLTQEQLAAKTGFHRTYIGMIERGERNISLNNIAVFAKVFEMDLSTLLDFSSVNPKHHFKKYQTKSGA